MQPVAGEAVQLRVWTGLCYFDFSVKIVAVAADWVTFTHSCGTEGHLQPDRCEWLTPEGNWQRLNLESRSV